MSMPVEKCSEEVQRRREIFDLSVATGCCYRCAFRFLGLKNTFNYADPKNDLERLFSFQIAENEGKRRKTNPCITCLDILTDWYISDVLESEDLKNVFSYDNDHFVNYLSIPKAVSIRSKSMEIFLKQKFPEYYQGAEHGIEPFNKIWTKAIVKRLEDVTRKKRTDNLESNLQIHFTCCYELDDTESAVIGQINRSSRNSNCNGNIRFSRNNLTEVLKNISDEEFRKHVQFPPELPTKSIENIKIHISHEPIFVAGRYCKYSRKLGQTPWFDHDNVRKCESSVQEIIFDALKDVFKSDDMVFSASGREDFDVRTLGRGRPFFIKIQDPKFTKVSYQQFREIEKEIKNSNLIGIQDLQQIEKDSNYNKNRMLSKMQIFKFCPVLAYLISLRCKSSIYLQRSNISLKKLSKFNVILKALPNIKMGEEDTQKTYRALCCISDSSNMYNYISIINKIDNLTLEQKTPVRVYHRRSSGKRLKNISKITAKVVQGWPNLMELDLTTQAGTYVKEFVHGDLGRTKPSLGELIGTKIDIIALDVLEIHIDFPPHVTSKEK